MELKNILTNIDYELVCGNVTSTINKINYDSRKVEENDIFVCIKGFATDGHKYINKAIENGAKVIIIQDDVKIQNENIIVIKVSDTRKTLACIGANYYNNPSKKMKVIGVTGTNGQ